MKLNELVIQVLMQKEGYSKPMAERMMQKLFLAHPSWAVEGNQEVAEDEIAKYSESFGRYLDFWNSNKELAAFVESVELKKEQKLN